MRIRLFASRKGVSENKDGMRWELEREMRERERDGGIRCVDRYTKRYIIFTIDDDNRMNMRGATLIHMAR